MLPVPRDDAAEPLSDGQRQGPDLAAVVVPVVLQRILADAEREKEGDGMNIPWKSKADAFNLGSDARIAGHPYCPYAEYTMLASYWQAGYFHADKFWGVDAKWEVMPLPEVREVA